MKSLVSWLFPTRQKNKDSCALMSTRAVLLARDGSAPNEADMIKIGEASGAYTACNGTTNEAAVMTKAGVPATEVFKPSIDDIAASVDEGKGVVVGYDTRPVWGGGI
jgi:hypothetical protein